MSTLPTELVSQASRPSHRVEELDGLRAFAILPVILHHCYPYDGWLRGLAFIGEGGWIGVDLFFVLSGYLITGILLDTVKRPHYYRNFIARRTLRIFPLYYLCLALFTVATKLSPASWAALQAWGGVSWFFIYLGNIRAAWVNDLPPVFAFAPLWSLQVEEQFYLLYPLVVAVLSIQNLRRFLIGFAIAAPLLRLSLVLFVPNSAEACYVLMPCRMDALALGGILAIMVRSPSGIAPFRVQVRFASIIGAAVVVVMFLVALQYQRFGTAFLPFMRSIGYSVIDITSAAILSFIVLSPTSKLAAVLRWRPLVYTGQIAYGLYLLHGPASWIARKLIALLTTVTVEPHSALSIPITFAASFIAAGLSWRFFESPMLALKERFTYRS